jgi:hypothetical protein
MKTWLAAAAVLLLVPAPLLAADKEAKSTLPGKATWDLRAFNLSFKVLETTYDDKSKEVTWVLETKEGVRTLDFVRELDKTKPFTFVFLDKDGTELATVQFGSDKFKGIPKERIMPKGTQLQAVLEVPDVLDKAKSVVLRRGADK